MYPASRQRSAFSSAFGGPVMVYKVFFVVYMTVKRARSLFPPCLLIRAVQHRPLLYPWRSLCLWSAKMALFLSSNPLSPSETRRLGGKKGLYSFVASRGIATHLGACGNFILQLGCRVCSETPSCTHSSCFLTFGGNAAPRFFRKGGFRGHV